MRNLGIANCVDLFVTLKWGEEFDFSEGPSVWLELELVLAVAPEACGAGDRRLPAATAGLRAPLRRLCQPCVWNRSRWERRKRVSLP